MKKINLIIILAAIVIVSSCRKIVPMDEQSPNAFPGATADLMIAGPQMATVMVAEEELARYAGIFDNQFTGSDRQYVSVNNYTVTRGDFDNVWSTIYVDGVKNCRIIQTKATATGNKSQLGVAQILEAYLIGTATSLWGDVPFSQAVDVENFPNPVFDKQSDVYAGIQKLLDEGIANIGSKAVGEFGSVYNASGVSWAQVANSLKARYYLHTGDYANAVTAATNGISGGDWEANHDVSGWTDGKFNLMFSFMVWHREGYMTANGAYLPQLLDPNSTTNRYNAKTLDTARFNYMYMDASACWYCSDYDPNYWSGGIFMRDVAYPLFSQLENELILAEAKLMTSDAAGALTNLNAAREYWDTKFSVDEYQDYVLTDFDAGGIADHSKGNQTDNLRFEILQEKYAALMGQIEPWNDMRRTKNFIDLPLKTGSKYPERFLVPQSEINSNTSAPKDKELFDPTEVNM